MSNESMANQITDIPSAVAELLAINKQLKQQLEVYKNSDKVLSDTLESRENDILKLNRQLEEHKKFILGLKHPDGQLGSCICPSCISIDKFLAKYRVEK